MAATAKKGVSKSRQTAAGPSASRVVAKKMAALPPKNFRVRIRMYRQGVGDSFLLSFQTSDGLAHILIDCGVVTGTRDADEWSRRIAEDVVATTADENGLRAIVGTHPHWDHLSGFLTAQSTFARLPKTDVFMAWSEDPSDLEGRLQKSRQRAQLAGLRSVVASLAATTDLNARAHGAAINDLLSFFGPDDGRVAPGAVGGRTTEDAVSALRGLGQRITYCKPGESMTPTWLPGVRIYVLGPPRDEKMLGKMLSKAQGDLYALGDWAGLVSALDAKAGEGPGAPGAASALASAPFESSYLFPRDKAVAYDTTALLATRYADAAEDWRKIDDQWLLSAETLALQLDNAINNLSLVLAFEFVESQDVLLFAADAQVGNWLSWQKLNWNVTDDDGSEREVSSVDLLARTVFYKVGHHGSHNATLKEGGLEDMTHPDLVAAIPVDEAFANGTKHWAMPAPALYDRLIKKTQGRVLRSDGKGPYAVDPEATIVQNDAGKAFCANVFRPSTNQDLYVDYYVC